MQRLKKLKCMVAAVFLGSVFLGSVSAQVTYTQSTVHVSEYDFDIKNVTVDGSGNVYYYTLARLIEKVSADGAYTNLSGFGSTVIRGTAPPDPSTGTLALEVALQMQDNNANLVADAAGNLFFYQDGLILELRASDQTIYRRSGGGIFKSAWLADGDSGLDVSFGFTGNMALDSSGRIYFGHYPAPANPHIMRLDTDGTVSKIGGGNSRGLEGADGPAVDAQIGFGHFDGLTVDPLGNVFLADDRVLLRIGTDGVMKIIHNGGDGVATSTFSGEDISTVSVGAFNSIAAGPDGSLFFEADKDIHQLSPDGTLTTLTSGQNAGRLAVDKDGNIYFANNANTGSSDDHSVQKLTRSEPFTGTAQAVGGAVSGSGDGTAGGDGTTGGGDDTTGGDETPAVTLPEGTVGPMGLDLDTAAGDQMVRQTPTNPKAGDQIQVDVFITEGATGQFGFNTTLAWDPAALTYTAYASAGIFAGGVSLTTPTTVTSADSTVELSVVKLGSTASGDSGSGGLATFTVNEGFSGSTTVRLTNGKVGSTEIEIGPGAAFVVIGGQTNVAKSPAEAANFDGDPTVGFGDFLIFAGGFGKTSSDGDFDTRLDLDGDGAIGFGDFLAFASVFGQTI